MTFLFSFFSADFLRQIILSIFHLLLYHTVLFRSSGLTSVYTVLFSIEKLFFFVFFLLLLVPLSLISLAHIKNEYKTISKKITQDYPVVDYRTGRAPQFAFPAGGRETDRLCDSLEFFCFCVRRVRLSHDSTVNTEEESGSALLREDSVRALSLGISSQIATRRPLKKKNSRVLHYAVLYVRL